MIINQKHVNVGLWGGMILGIIIAAVELLQKNFSLFHSAIPQIVSWIFAIWMLVTIVLLIINEHRIYKEKIHKGRVKSI